MKTLISTLLFTTALTTSALLTTPALADPVTISEPHGQTVTGDLNTGPIPAPGWAWNFPWAGDRGFKFVGFTGPGFWEMTPGNPYAWPHGYDGWDWEIGLVFQGPKGCILNACYQPPPYVYSTLMPTYQSNTTFTKTFDMSIPFDPFIGGATLNTPVTVSDSEGDSTTFERAFSLVDLGLSILAFTRYDSPVLGLVMTGVEAIDNFYGPVKQGVSTGFQNMVNDTILNGLTSMGAGHVPIGPDPEFTYNLWFGDTQFSGTFDATGDINNFTDVHNISLFADGVPVSTPGAVPETSTWLMLGLGFTLLGWWRYHAKNVIG